MAKSIIKSEAEFIMGVRNLLVAKTRNQSSALVFETEQAAQAWLAAHTNSGYGFNGAGFRVVAA